jgi:hypothetical protein
MGAIGLSGMQTVRRCACAEDTAGLGGEVRFSRGPRRVGKGPLQQFASRGTSRELFTLEAAIVS